MELRSLVQANNEQFEHSLAEKSQIVLKLEHEKSCLQEGLAEKSQIILRVEHEKFSLQGEIVAQNYFMNTETSELNDEVQKLTEKVQEYKNQQNKKDKESKAHCAERILDEIANYFNKPYIGGKSIF